MDQAIHQAPSIGHTSLSRKIGWALVWLALAAWSAQFLLAVFGKYSHIDMDSYGMFWLRRGWLWAHLGGGTLTILLGPAQFLTRWPRFYPRLHRWLGRVYLSGMLIALTGAVGLIATSPAPTEIRTAFAATALAWSSTALTALIAIRRGHVLTHRRWMIRNYLVTLSPITFRVMLQVALVMGLMPTPGLIAVMLWLSWSLPVLVYEAGRRVIGSMRAR